MRVGAAAFAVLFAALASVAGGAGPSSEAAPVFRPGGPVNLIRVDGSINPASADFILKSIRESEEDGAAALILELDTPGGLLASTKDIIQGILNAAVPVVVYVAPRGAWAGSAGTFITLAGHVAAMAPGTSIGAAHPVGIGGGGGEKEGEGGRDFAAEKAENFTAAFIESIARERGRNVEWAVKAVRESVAIAQDEALRIGVIDLVAETREDLLAQLEGRVVKLRGREVALSVAGAPVRVLEMDLLTRIMHVLASPDVAVLLLLAGAVGLYVEFNQPGLILPGVVGAVCLILGFIALQILPFSWTGLLLLALGVGFFVAEAFLTSYGAFFAAGLICFLLGGSMIFDLPELGGLQVSFYTVLLPAAAAFALAAGTVVYAVGRARRAAPQSGVGELLGARGRADGRLAPAGRVFIHGEYWNAVADEAVEEGETVEVVGVEGLCLRVRRARPAGGPGEG